MFVIFFFFFQAEDGIRDAQESRGLGDVYKRQVFYTGSGSDCRLSRPLSRLAPARAKARRSNRAVLSSRSEVCRTGRVTCASRTRFLLVVAVGRLGGSLPHTDRCGPSTVSYTHLRAHETPEHLVCRLLLE